jgi:hypothetical protein
MMMMILFLITFSVFCTLYRVCLNVYASLFVILALFSLITVERIYPIESCESDYRRLFPGVT